MLEVLRSGRLSLGPLLARVRARRSRRASARRTRAPSRAGPRACTWRCARSASATATRSSRRPFSFVASANVARLRARAAGVRRHRSGHARTSIRRRRRGGGHRAHGGAAAGARVRLPGRHAGVRAAGRCRSSRTPARRSARCTPTASPVGGRGHPAVFGFYANKQLTTGEGGMVTIGDAGAEGADRLRAKPGPRARTWAGSTTTGSASTTGCRTSPARSGWPSSSASTRCSPAARAWPRCYREALAGHRGAAAAVPRCRRRPPRVVRVRRPAPARRRPRRRRARARRARDPEQALLPGDPPDELLPRAVRAPRGRVPGVRGRRRALDRAAVLPADDRAARSSGWPRRCAQVLAAATLHDALVSRFAEPQHPAFRAPQRLDRLRLAAGPLRRRAVARARVDARRAGDHLRAPSATSCIAGWTRSSASSPTDRSRSPTATRTSTWRSSAALTEIVGPVGGKLHTARSRNDQVATDVAMFVRAHAHEALERDRAAWRRRWSTSPSAHLDWPMPGYTHLQRAQPVYLSHHLLAYFWMLIRDRDRFAAVVAATGRLPLGAGALAGVNFDTDRERGRARAGLLGRRARTRSTPSPTATSCSTTWPRPPPARPTCRVWAPRSCCGPARSSASARSPTPGRRARRSCRRRRTPTRPSCCAPRRRGVAAHLVGAARRHARPAADLQQGHAGGQGAPVRRRRHARAVPRRGRTGCSTTITFRPRAAGRRRRRRVPRRDRHRRPAGAPRASRSARPTASSPGWCARAVDEGKPLSELTRTSWREHSPLLDDGVLRACSRTAPGSSPRSPRAGPACARVREQLAARAALVR